MLLRFVVLLFNYNLNNCRHLNIYAKLSVQCALQHRHLRAAMNCIVIVRHGNKKYFYSQTNYGRMKFESSLEPIFIYAKTTATKIACFLLCFLFDCSYEAD